MKKTVLALTMGLLFVVILITLSGCGTKYCSISDCPSETVGRFSYCAKHKCRNSKCENRNIGAIEGITNYSVEEYSYCRICLAR